MSQALKRYIYHIDRKVGICGGFTTFSSFALETNQLMERGSGWWATLYVTLSVTGAMAAVYASQYISGKIRFHFDARRVTMKNQAYYHLPGLFEFYELYRVFLSLYREHREYFYDWCEIGSIYGAPSDCIWGGGRTSFGDTETEKKYIWIICWIFFEHRRVRILTTKIISGTIK